MKVIDPGGGPGRINHLVTATSRVIPLPPEGRLVVDGKHLDDTHGVGSFMNRENLTGAQRRPVDWDDRLKQRDPILTWPNRVGRLPGQPALAMPARAMVSELPELAAVARLQCFTAPPT